MRLVFSAFISALIVMAFSVPALAAEDGKIDIMNPYKDQQKKVVEKSNATSKAYNDRWYDYVEDRYGGKIDRPEDQTAKSDISSDTSDAESDTKTSDTADQ